MQAIWELDFYSRPLLDENQKKIWEVLICESPQKIDRDPNTLFKYSQFCDSTTVNSIFLREAIEKAIDTASQSPQKIRFFRRPMNNMICKACEELGISPVPSRRTYALDSWLAERIESFYPQQEGYDAAAANSASIQYPAMNVIPLPEAVKGDKGDKWAFVTLEVEAFADMNQWDIGFGEAFPLQLAGLGLQAKIPGLLLFSPRATALAAWMSGLEMGYLQFEAGSRPIIRLETGFSDSWILANLTNAGTLQEAERFSKAQQEAKGVHFLAIQSSPESESFAGFWLLRNSS